MLQDFFWLERLRDFLLAQEYPCFFVPRGGVIFVGPYFLYLKYFLLIFVFSVDSVFFEFFFSLYFLNSCTLVLLYLCTLVLIFCFEEVNG